ncbi:pyridoxal kinase [Aquicoccus sp. SCR17]|nr:pyridoxal kinase [Carideicomes alvinocaridis]
MAHILILSSWVAEGHVGLSAGAPVLQVLGHHVTQLPTVILSNHLGFSIHAGGPVPVAQLDDMLVALERNGWLGRLDAVQTGYLPTPDHVDLAVRMVERLRKLSPSAPVLVDPIIGDAPEGLYVDAAAGHALRERLLPLADTLTPNLFELNWLTGLPTGTPTEAIAAARSLHLPRVLVTSPPLPGGQTGLIEVTPGAAMLHPAPRHPDVPSGTGDVLAALVASGVSPGQALGHLTTLVEASRGLPHLDIAGSAPRWRAAAAIPGRSVEEVLGL